METACGEGADCCDRTAGAESCAASVCNVAALARFGDGTMAPWRACDAVAALLGKGGASVSFASAKCGLLLVARSGLDTSSKRVYISVEDLLRVLGGGKICAPQC